MKLEEYQQRAALFLNPASPRGAIFGYETLGKTATVIHALNCLGIRVHQVNWTRFRIRLQVWQEKASRCYSIFTPSAPQADYLRLHLKKEGIQVITPRTQEIF